MSAVIKSSDEQFPVPAFDAAPSALTWKEKIAWLVDKLSEGPRNPCPVEHIFGHGMYVRKIFVPADTLFLGRAHLKGHQVSLLSGSLIWITEHGRRHIDKHLTIHTQPGFHMVCYTLTDVTAQTVHANPMNSTDIQALEDEFFEPVSTLRQIAMRVDERLRLT